MLERVDFPAWMVKWRLGRTESERRFRSSQSMYVSQRHDWSGRGGSIYLKTQEGVLEMMMTKKNVVLGVALVATLGLGGCATYKDEFATINSRLDSLDTKVQGAAQSAESANQSAQQANQRLDQIESRVQRLESVPAKRQPRG